MEVSGAIGEAEYQPRGQGVRADETSGGELAASPRQPSQRHHAAAPSSPARKRRRISAAVWSGIAGFVLGAVFWHLVGFWSFVSHVVFKGPAADGAGTIETGALPPPRRDMLKPKDPSAKDLVGKELAKLKDPVTGEARPLDTAGATNVSSCASLDRSGRSTRVAVCSDRQMPTLSGRSDRAAPREDLASPSAEAVSASTWTIQVDASETALPGR